jgi:hypothetical protein
MSLVRASAALAVVLALAGCAPEIPAPSTSASATPTPTVSATASAPTDSAPAPPETVDPSTFLIDGTPFVADADGYWKGHYAFFTDDSETVRCDIYIYSGDSGGLTCAVTAGNDSTVTYALPAAQCDPSMSNPYDGLSVGINFKVFDTGNAGFTGCGVGAFFETQPGSDLPNPKVLKDNQTLNVITATYNYTCTVSKGVASCSEALSGASIKFGLSVAEFAG